LSVKPGLRDSNDLRVGRKIANFQLFLFSRVGLRTYQHPCTLFGVQPDDGYLHSPEHFDVKNLFRIHVVFDGLDVGFILISKTRGG